MEVEYMQEEENSPESQGGNEATTIKEEEKVNNRILNKLNELKQELKDNQSTIQEDQIELDTLKKATEVLKGNITELEKSGEDIDKVFDEYGKAYYDIDDKKTDLKDYYDYKQPLIFDALTEKMREKIDEKRKEVDEDTIDTYKDRVKWLKEQITTAERKKADAKKELEIKQKEYDELSDRKKEIENKLAYLSKLKKSIESIEEEGKHCYKSKMYSLIKDFEICYDLLNTEFVAQEDLKDGLIVKWGELALTKDEFRKIEKDLNNHLDELKAKEKILVDTKKDRETIIFDKICGIPEPEE